MSQNSYSPSALCALINSGRIGVPLTHSHALDAIAVLEGTHDWNAVSRRPDAAVLKSRANALRVYVNAHAVDGKITEGVAISALLLAGKFGNATAGRPVEPAALLSTGAATPRPFSGDTPLRDLVVHGYAPASPDLTQARAVEAARHRFGDIPIRHAMLAWNDQTAQVCVIPHPDEHSWTDRLGMESTVGACGGYWDELPKRGRQLALMTEAMQLAMEGRIALPLIHEALMVVPEYRELMGPDAVYPPLCPPSQR